MGEARAEISFCILLFIPANIVVPCQHYVRAKKLGGGREGGREGGRGYPSKELVF